MRRSYNCSEIVRVLDAVEEDQQLRARDAALVIGVAMRRAERNHALVGCALRHAIQRLARLEADGDISLAAQIDDLLDARSAGAFRHKHAVEGSTRCNGLAHG